MKIDTGSWGKILRSEAVGMRIVNNSDPTHWLWLNIQSEYHPVRRDTTEYSIGSLIWILECAGLMSTVA